MRETTLPGFEPGIPSLAQKVKCMYTKKYKKYRVQFLIEKLKIFTKFE